MKTVITITLRILMAALLFGGGIWAVDWYFSTDYLGAVWRLMLWFWRMLVELMIRIVGTISTSGAAMLRAAAQRTFWRRLTRFAWRFLTVVFLVWWLGQIRTDKLEEWLGIQKTKVLERLKGLAHAKPDWPRGVRASIALVAIGILMWAYFWISDNIGELWGFAASIVFVELVAYLRVLGFDALVSWVTEKWAPVARFIERHQWIRRLWLGPLFAWVFGKIEDIKDWHGERHDGKGKIDEWIERRSEFRGETVKIAYVLIFVFFCFSALHVAHWLNGAEATPITVQR